MGTFLHFRNLHLHNIILLFDNKYIQIAVASSLNLLCYFILINTQYISFAIYLLLYSFQFAIYLHTLQTLLCLLSTDIADNCDWPVSASDLYFQRIPHIHKLGGTACNWL